MHVTHELEKFINFDSNILILGTMPSIISRKNNFYYSNPNNRFYKVLSAIYNEDFHNADIEMKKQLLKKHHIALYDVIFECDILNSSDQSIKNVIPTNIQDLVDNYPIKKIFINGKKAYELFIKYNKELINMAVCLPSTSPANASYKLEDLINSWKIINKD